MVRTASKTLAACRTGRLDPSSVGFADTFSRKGRRVLVLTGLPTRSGYSAYESPLQNNAWRCTGATKRPPKIDAPDPPRDRAWRLDEVRTAALVRLLAADPRVRRIFIEPHLKARLGLTHLAKVRFAGCQAARHDDHIHIDFY